MYLCFNSESDPNTYHYGWYSISIRLYLAFITIDSPDCMYKHP